MRAGRAPRVPAILGALAVAGTVFLGGCAEIQRDFEALAPSEDFIRDLIERVDTYAGYPAPRLDPGMRPSPATRPPATAAGPPAAAAPPPPAPPPNPDRYVVRPGDTLFGLARTYGTTPQAIAAANDLGDRTTLRTGERLVIPGDGSQPAPPGTAPTPADKPDSGALAAAQTPESSAPSSPVTSTPLPPPGGIPAPSTTVTPIVPPAATPEAASPATPEAASPAATGSEAERRLTAPDTASPAQPEAAPAQPSAPTVPTQTTAASPAAPADDGGGRFGWPLRGPLISGFGSRADGVRNDGVNIKADAGTPVHAAASGVVVYAGNELRGFGELLLIRHTDGLTSAYAHNSELLVRRGQRVRRGQVIARVGQTGSVSSPQLHFEIRQGSQPVDPMRYLGG